MAALKEKRFKSSNKLKFKTAPHLIGGAVTGMEKFIVGTVHGLWVQGIMSVDVFAIINEEPGNGHMTDAIEWFIEIAKELKLPLRVVEINSLTFKRQLLNEWNFQPTEHNNQVIKTDFLQ